MMSTLIFNQLIFIAMNKNEVCRYFFSDELFWAIWMTYKLAQFSCKKIKRKKFKGIIWKLIANLKIYQLYYIEEILDLTQHYTEEMKR